ncbi:helix-turn-helix domain-containing protein [Actinomadura rubrisoli]|uniref:Helix-turn-helix domain-containing protein n=1 Tax=Actinomadura rubrisoli TaxID=2530368 RepID=A0A4R5AH96_9ACTN|nr:helix-turn-helix domain-containing protein [Actinomadura rubrisoli]TDD70304.1 helix-turn-helix domain-containing protein [Actinomadura rubrisoli]
MYDISKRHHALRLLEQGLTVSEVSRRTGISRYALREWRLRVDQGRDLYAVRSSHCPRCSGVPRKPEHPRAYAYLLGLYLGDGCISPVGDPAKKIWALRISCANSWPGIMRECAEAVHAIRPDNKIRFIPCTGCTEVNSHSKHWPCLFPQHGPGKKHQRKIELETWQQEIVDEFAEAFVRGLIHSDGCRVMNRVRRPCRDGDRWYEYPRYNFTNVSMDIQRLFTDALDRLGVQWTQMNRKNISVARREAVARLDEFVGPKY